MCRSVVHTGSFLSAVYQPSPAAGPAADFVSRFFAPGYGVDEDPVTGYAHCILGPYWQAKLGRDQFLAHQASARARRRAA